MIDEMPGEKELNCTNKHERKTHVEQSGCSREAGRRREAPAAMAPVL